MDCKKLTFGIVFLLTSTYILFVWQMFFQETVKGINLPTRYSSDFSSKTSLFFLKTHKCGSSTVQNIFMRFGKKHNLNFVLPEKANYVGNPRKFSRALIGKSVALENGGKYDIFTHHTRYDYLAVKEAMKEDAHFFTIMREPVSLQQSLYDYYNFPRIHNMPLNGLLRKPLRYLRNITRVKTKLGWNQMAWDLGVNVQNISSSQTNNSSMEFVDNVIEQMEKEFDLVMIMEFMEVSLVLLSDLMRWSLEDVRFLKLNERRYERKNETKTPLTDEGIRKLEELNFIDVRLYEHSRKRLKERVINYGVERMIYQVKRLVAMNEEVYSKCVNGTTGYIQHYLLKGNAPPECGDFIKTELQLTAELRRIQRAKVEAERKLRTLLTRR